MEGNLRHLLDLIYEMEGLLHLSLKRDEFQEDFLRLVVKKGREVAKICESFELWEQKQDDKPFNLDEYYIAEEIDNDEKEIGNEGLIAETENEEDEIIKFKEGSRISNGRGKLVFSVNDKFRFRKELFENSDINFNNSLALVASMDDYEEAEVYFINDVGLNPSDPTVNDFLEIVKRYFT